MILTQNNFSTRKHTNKLNTITNILFKKLLSIKTDGVIHQPLPVRRSTLLTPEKKIKRPAPNKYKFTETVKGVINHGKYPAVPTKLSPIMELEYEEGSDEEEYDDEEQTKTPSTMKSILGLPLYSIPENLDETGIEEQWGCHHEYDEAGNIIASSDPRLSSYSPEDTNEA
jgi:hypothetical protein